MDVGGCRQSRDMGTGVGVGEELEGSPFAIDAVGAEGAEEDTVEGVGGKTREGDGVVGER